MIPSAEQRQTIAGLEQVTHLASHLLLALALLAFLLAPWPLLAVLLLSCAVLGGTIGWIRREQPTALLWYAIGAGAIATLVLTALQMPQVPVTFDGVLGLLGRMLAGLAACQAFERASTRASTLRQTIAFVLLSVAVTTVLREQPLWSLGALALFLALWIFARRCALLLAKLRQQPLTLVNVAPRHYRWTGQAGMSATAFCLIGAFTGLAFWGTPRVPLPSIPVLQGPFGTMGAGASTPPYMEDRSNTGYTQYLTAELAETLKQIGRARNLSDLDQLTQRAHGILDFLEETGKVERIQLELLRKFSRGLSQRQMRQLADQEEHRRNLMSSAARAPEEEHLQALQEEMDWLRDILPHMAEPLQQLQQQLARSTSVAQAQQLEERMAEVAASLPAPVNLETPVLQQLIERVGADRQATLAAMAALQQAETDRLRERFEQAVRAFAAALERQLPEAAWPQRVEALRTSATAAEGQREADALMRLLAHASDRQALTPPQTSALAQQLDVAAELRADIERQELRPPDLKHPDRLAQQMTATAAKLQEAQARWAGVHTSPDAAAQATEVRILQAQYALQQAAQRAGQAAAAWPGERGAALQQTVTDLAAAASASEARQAAGQLQQALAAAARDASLATPSGPSLQRLRHTATDLLQQQLRAAVTKSQARLSLSVSRPTEEVFWSRPYILCAIDITGAKPASGTFTLASGERQALGASGVFMDPSDQVFRNLPAQLLLPAARQAELQQALVARQRRLAVARLERLALALQERLHQQVTSIELLLSLEHHLRAVVDAGVSWTDVQRSAGLFISTLGRLHHEADRPPEQVRALAEELRALILAKFPPLGDTPLTDLYALSPDRVAPPLQGVLAPLANVPRDQRPVVAGLLSQLAEAPTDEAATALHDRVEAAVAAWRSVGLVAPETADALLLCARTLGAFTHLRRTTEARFLEVLQAAERDLPEDRLWLEAVKAQAGLEASVVPTRSVAITPIVTWASSDPAVALMEGNSLLATGEGTARIVATLRDMTSLPEPVTVRPAYLLRVEVDPLRAAVERGRTLTLTARGQYSDRRTRVVHEGLTWISRAPAIASVRPDGTVRGHRVGQTEIVARVGPCTSPPAPLRVFDPLWKRLLQWLLVLLGPPAVAVAGMAGRRRAVERRLADLQRRDPRRFIIVVYHLLARQWEWLGWPRTRSMIPEEYEQVLRRTCGPAVLSALQTVTDLFLHAHYSRAPMLTAHSQQMAQAHQTLTTKVCGRLPRWQRLWLWLRGGMLRLP